MGGLNAFEQAVLQKWKTLKHVYTFMKRELEKINELCFGGGLSIPQVALKPLHLSRKPLEEFASCAYYAPASGDKAAEIGLFPNILLSRRKAKVALAHEMVHHWEWTAPEGKEEDAAQIAEKTVERLFPKHRERQRWRRHHSARFLSKASLVAAILKIPLSDFLVRH